MKTRTILLWCLLGAMIVSYLIVKMLIQDFHIDEVKTIDEMSQVTDSIVKGYDILKDYDANYEGIKNNLVDFTIVNKSNALIPFEGRAGLEKIIYNLTDYYKIEYTYKNIKYMIYSVNDYDQLERNVTSKEKYNNELLATYLDVDKSTLKTKVDVSRDLQEGEAYGRTVISTFENKKDLYEDGTLYFILDNENIFKLDVLKTKVKEFDIYKKEYELNAEGNLVGYTFTKVLE